MKNVTSIVFGIAFLAASGIAISLYNKNKQLAKEYLDINKRPYRLRAECGNPYTGTMHWIKLAEAVGMVREYGENQAYNINMGRNKKLRPTPTAAVDSFMDSRFITFPLDTLKKFIWIIENMLDDAGPLNDNGDSIRTCDLGIKFYYSTYEGLQPTDRIKQTYKGRHTLLLVPAYLNTSSDIYTDFFPAFKETTGKPSTLANLIAREYNADTAYVRRGGAPILGMASDDRDIGRNHGTLCPPPDGCISDILKLAARQQ
jgi:hypothetical protein